MGILFKVWQQLVEHSWEILWALVFGLFFDLVSPRSRLKTLIRIIANQLSVVSVKWMRMRIASLERQRIRTMRVLELEEVSYRRLWGITILILMYLSMAIGMCFVYFVIYLLSPANFFPQGLWWAGLIVLTFAAAVASGFGAYPDMWDERSQVEKRAGELGNEIENLKKKVQARLHKSIAA